MKKNALTRRSFLAGAATVSAVAAMGLAGCGGGEKTESTSSTESTTAADNEVTEDEAGEVPAAGGGKITAALANKSSNYNPIGLNGGSATMLAATWHVFEGLYELDMHDYHTYNALAADVPNVVDDTHYEVTLRDGAKFSDGTDVTADDVVNAFEMSMQDGTCGPFLTFIKTVTAKDDKTVEFELNYPFPTLFQVRMALVKIVPKSQTEDDLKQMPIGTGPWKYVSINGEEGGIIEFAPNENYNGSLPATADSMTWNVLVDNDARTTALTDGSVMAINALPATNADLVNSVGATAEFVPGFNQPFFMFNTSRKPFDDVRVRQAFFYAVDVDKLIANQMEGHAEATTSFLIKTMPNYHEASTVYTYDPEKAKSLLDEAGVTDLTMKLLTNNTFVIDLAPQIKNDLEAVGIKCSIDEQAIQWAELNVPDPDFDVMLTGGDATCFGNDPDILMGWWFADNDWMNYRSCWKTTDPENWQKLQDLMQQARETSDEAEQQEAWNECFDIIAENVPLYSLFHMDMVTGFYPEKLQGFEPISTTGLVFLGATPTEA